MSIAKEETSPTTDGSVPEKRRSAFSRFRAVVFVGPALLFVALLAVGLFRASPNVKPGGTAPSFDLDRLDGRGKISSDDLRGKPVVINFWASWCVPCREEAPRLEAAWKKYRGEGVTFLGINIQDAREDGLDFAKEFGFTFPQVRDPNSQAAGQFGLTGLPETFFIDHNWRFLAIAEGASTGQRQGSLVIRGAISDAELRSYITALIDRYKATIRQR